MSNSLRVLATIAALHVVQLSSSGQFIQVNVGNVPLQPNQSGQIVDFSVENTSPTALGSVFGLNFLMQVGDGTAGPVIQEVSLFSGDSIFATFSGNQSVAGGSWAISAGIDTGSGSTVISLPGSSSTLLARVKFDTTGLGLGSGPWTLNFNNVGPSHLATAYAQEIGGTPSSRAFDSIINGSISIVPEPAAYSVVMGMFAVGLVAYRRFRK